MLRRNRDFALLQGGQLLSAAGSQATAIAYPLLVLALTGSQAQAGVVAFARTVPYALLGLPAGVVADRFDRRAVMIAADVVRALTGAALGLLVALDAVAFWQIPVAAFVEGAGSAFFAPAAAAALRAVVPEAALADAVNVQQVRIATVSIAGPPVGGALFGLGRAVPFLADAVSYAFSVLSLALMRTPFQQARAVVRPRMADGWRFLWRQPFLRTTTFLYGLANFIGPGLLLAIVILGHEQDLSGGAIGLLLAAFGGCLLLGGLASPLIRRRLSARAILLLELWAWTACAIAVIEPGPYVLTAAMLPAAL